MGALHFTSGEASQPILSSARFHYYSFVLRCHSLVLLGYTGRAYSNFYSLRGLHANLNLHKSSQDRGLQGCFHSWNCYFLADKARSFRLEMHSALDTRCAPILLSSLLNQSARYHPGHGMMSSIDSKLFWPHFNLDFYQATELATSSLYFQHPCVLQCSFLTSLCCWMQRDFLLQKLNLRPHCTQATFA